MFGNNAVSLHTVSQIVGGIMLDIFCDGLCEPVNPGGTATWGFVVKRDGVIIKKDCGILGSGAGMTNNVAEYSAAVNAIQWLKEHHLMAEEVTLRSDSQLLIYQLQGRYAVRSERLRPLYHQLIKDLKAFRRVSFRWIPREQNEEADALSRQAYWQGQDDKRKERGAELVKDVVKIEDNLFNIEGKEYVINLEDKSCTCPDFVKRHRVCKHLWAVLLAEQQSPVD